MAQVAERGLGQLARSADTARQIDPQLAAIYHDQMVAKGAAHTKALAVVAARLAERAWVVMARGTPYEILELTRFPGQGGCGNHAAPTKSV